MFFDQAAQQLGFPIAVIPAGERWPPDGSLRPGWEDWIGAGVVIAYPSGRPSPEAALALAAFRAAEPGLAEGLAACSFGRELVDRSFADDVRLAAQHNSSAAAPILIDRAFVRAGGPKAAG